MVKWIAIYREKLWFLGYGDGVSLYIRTLSHGWLLYSILFPFGIEMAHELPQKIRNDQLYLCATTEVPELLLIIRNPVSRRESVRRRPHPIAYSGEWRVSFRGGSVRLRCQF